MRGGRTFVDTNVFLYTVDSSDAHKQYVARELVADICLNGSGYVSSQILKEYGSNLVRKFGRTPAQAAVLCSSLSDFAVVSEGLPELLDTLRIMTVASISFWDACIVAAARSAGCSVLLTEDLSHGQVIEGVRIRNPFV